MSEPKQMESKQAAIAMRNMPLDERDEAIAASANVIDGQYWLTDHGGINFNGPEKGDTLKVVDVEPARCSFGDGWYLRFNGDPQNWWAATSFRKVSPLDSKCDTEFAETIREASRRSLRTKAWYDAKERLGL